MEVLPTCHSLVTWRKTVRPPGFLLSAGRENFCPPTGILSCPLTVNACISGSQWALNRMEFRVLGSLEVRRRGRPLALGGAQQRALLAMLLIEANRPMATDRLVQLLWVDAPPQPQIT